MGRASRRMKIARFETYLANAGLRNYLFVRLVTDTGLSGIGEATLEWQERTVQTLLHEWVEARVLGRDPFDIQRLVGDLVRDQYQGGSTVMTAISGVELALWDIVGKACGQPVYRLFGGRYHRRLPAYANGWYSGAAAGAAWADKARTVVARGYSAMKFDPFGTAWKEMSGDEIDAAVERVALIREAVGPQIDLMIEFHGRLSAPTAIEVIRRLEPYKPRWCEEPVAPERVELLAKVKRRTQAPIAAGERLMTEADFQRMLALGAVDVVQMDICHCGGLLASHRIAAMAAAVDVQVAPHCSIGPVALAAALHFDVCTPNFVIQEAFAEFDVPWRRDLVSSSHRLENGEFTISDAPGLGVELNLAALSDHPYVPQSFPSLWDSRWTDRFNQSE
ncbi:MAG TPA: galactonate dehydratase [Pirellulales bacterium]|nr:galactonate dehydratase [Pirellulales bacterium]